MENHISCVFLLSVLFQASIASQCIRYEYNYVGYDFTTTLYCSHGCCGGRYDRYCCPYNSIWGAGAIAGSVVGGVIGFVILVSLIVCCVKACTKTGSYGRVVQPGQHHGVFVVNTTANQGYYPPQSGVPYGRPAQTAFGQTPTAYPNPSVVYPNPTTNYPGPPGSNIPAIGPAQYIPPPQGKR